MQAIQATMFDYAALDAETRIVVQQRTTEIKALMKRAASDIIEIGQKLIEVKARLGHDNWMPWLKTEFDWTDQTARNFMHVARAFANQNQKIFDFAPSALYLLSAPSTPESARIEAIERAEDGETITHGLARDIVHDHLHPADPFEDEELTPYEQSIAAQHNGSTPNTEDDWYNRPSLQTMHPAHRALHMNANQGGSNEWYTPAFLVEAARETMGKIDLDPASCDYANQAIKAEKIYTEEDDGLTQPWYGCIWMNPPYGKDEETNRSNQERWLDRLIEEYRDPAGNLDQAVIILNAVTDRKWFARLWDYPLCFTGRVYFYSETITRGSPTHGSVVAYFGQNVDRFVAAYRPHGRIVLPKGWYNEVAA